jgi:glycolate oxidase FAD binding subunit
VSLDGRRERCVDRDAGVSTTFEIWRSALAELADSVSLRRGNPGDAVDGVQPEQVVEPASAEDLAGVLACASRQRVSTVVSGSGTKLGWGRPPRPVDLVISTRRMNRVLVHAHGDLTATIQAGTTIRELNVELARYRQWLPVDTAFDRATVGGLIATNDSGSLRHRHGTPRDLLIGIHLATTDGRVVKAGGTVVKNVAGYDLGKLVSGSYGSLAAITSATFKLAPLPGASATVVLAFSDPEAIGLAATKISASQLEPTAFDVHAPAGSPRSKGASSRALPAGEPRPESVARPPYRLLIQFASTQAAIDAQVDELRRLVVADSIELMTGSAEAGLWQELSRALWAAPGAIVRASWLPANLRLLLSLLDEMAGEDGRAIELAARAGVGAGLIRLEGDAIAIVAAIQRLRARADVLGHVVVLRADSSVKQQIDVWGGPSDHEPLLAAIKRAFDPANILNAGRGPA